MPNRDDGSAVRDGYVLDDVPAAAAEIGPHIHLWLCDLDDARPPAALEICSEAEREMAARFPAKVDGSRYLVSRAILRTILSGYTGTLAEALNFSAGATGKPHLGDGNVCFNLSHSQNRLAVAVRAGGEIGVDIQIARPVDDAMGIARSLFAQSEIAHLETVHGDERRREFTRLWACREAVFKALGLPMTAGKVELARDRLGMFRFESQPREGGPLELREFDPGEGWAGAVAWPVGGGSPDSRLHLFEIAGEASPPHDSA